MIFFYNLAYLNSFGAMSDICEYSSMGLESAGVPLSSTSLLALLEIFSELLYLAVL